LYNRSNLFRKNGRTTSPITSHRLTWNRDKGANVINWKHVWRSIGSLNFNLSTIWTTL
jgi:hypothetical protein